MIGKDVWFDNVSIQHYNSIVLEEDHYYPFGLTMNINATNVQAQKNPYKYQGIELEKHFGLEQYETINRTIDGQLGRFWEIDPKAEKHYNESPFASMGNNPALNVDPLGDDWFVNNMNGEVVYFRGVSNISQENLNAICSDNQVSDYERLGADNMFGESVIDIKGEEVLDRYEYRVGNSEGFMSSRGYDKVSVNTIKEVTYIDKSYEGGGFDRSVVETPIPVSKDVLKSDISYAKPKDANKIEKISTVSKKMDFTNSLTKKTTIYRETKPFDKSSGQGGTTQGSAGWNVFKNVFERIAERLSKSHK